MKRTEFVQLIQSGIDNWNRWRENRRNIETQLENTGYLNFTKSHLTAQDFTGADLTRVTLNRSTLRRANFTKALLDKSNFCYSNLSGATFSGVTSELVDFAGSDLSAAKFSDIRFIKSNFKTSQINNATFSESIISESRFRETTFRNTTFNQVEIIDCDLQYATFINCRFINSSLINCDVYGVSVWDCIFESVIQSDLNIGRIGHPRITVDDLEMAPFISLLLAHEKLRSVITSLTQRGVLLLGRFRDDGHAQLRQIANSLKSLNYLPIIFDFDCPEHRDTTETIITLVSLVKFVVADLSGPSVPYELAKTVPHFMIPFVPIVAKGTKIFSMFKDLLKYPWVLQPIEYETIDVVVSDIQGLIIEPAEQRLTTLLK